MGASNEHTNTVGRRCWGGVGWAEEGLGEGNDFRQRAGTSNATMWRAENGIEGVQMRDVLNSGAAFEIGDVGAVLHGDEW